jgi:hypothetical protein
MNAANVRGIRVSLRLQSDRVDHSRGDNWPGDTLASPENRTAGLTIQGRRLFSSQVDVTLRNMSSTASFIF